jgi:hypothetical protein
VHVTKKSLLGSMAVAAALGTPLLIPATGSAHVSTACQNRDGSFTVSADPWKGTPVLKVEGIKVTWADGWYGNATLTGPCSTPPEPTPAPVPPVPEVVPPESQPKPPTTCAEKLALFPGAGIKHRIAWGCPVPPKKPHVKITTKRVEITIRRVPCFTPSNPVRSRSVHRIRVQWFKNGHLIRTKLSRPFNVYGAVCAVGG